MCFSFGGGGGGGGSTSVQPTADQIEQETIDANLWNYQEQYYKPLIEQYSKEITDPSTKAAEQRQTAGEINAEMMKNVPRATDNAAKNAQQLSKFGQAVDTTQQTGQLKTSETQVGEQQNVINIGRGQATQAIQGMGREAEQSVRSAIENQAISLEEQGATQATIGGLAGAAIGGAAAGYAKSLSNSGQLTEDPYVTGQNLPAYTGPGSENYDPTVFNPNALSSSEVQ